MKKLVEAGMSYEEVKKLVKISSLWGAKITGEQFKERVEGNLRITDLITSRFAFCIV